MKPDPYTFHSDNYDARIARKKAKHRPSARGAFIFIVRRIRWLDEKAYRCSSQGLPFDLYVEEREALLWILDKIKFLSARLLAYEEMYGPLKTKATEIATSAEVEGETVNDP